MNLEGHCRNNTGHPTSHPEKKPYQNHCGGKKTHHSDHDPENGQKHQVKEILDTRHGHASRSGKLELNLFVEYNKFLISQI
jgi:hypothetical protein